MTVAKWKIYHNCTIDWTNEQGAEYGFYGRKSNEKYATKNHGLLKNTEEKCWDLEFSLLKFFIRMFDFYKAEMHSKTSGKCLTEFEVDIARKYSMLSIF